MKTSTPKLRKRIGASGRPSFASRASRKYDAPPRPYSDEFRVLIESIASGKRSLASISPKERHEILYVRHMKSADNAFEHKRVSVKLQVGNLAPNPDAGAPTKSAIATLASNTLNISQYIYRAEKFAPGGVRKKGKEYEPKKSIRTICVHIKSHKFDKVLEALRDAELCDDLFESTSTPIDIRIEVDDEKRVIEWCHRRDPPTKAKRLGFGGLRNILTQIKNSR